MASIKHPVPQKIPGADTKLGAPKFDAIVMLTGRFPVVVVPTVGLVADRRKLVLVGEYTL
jgi:hypothetical protein